MYETHGQPSTPPCPPNGQYLTIGRIRQKIANVFGQRFFCWKPMLKKFGAGFMIFEAFLQFWFRGCKIRLSFLEVLDGM